jgi:hypothetical protein
MLKMENVSISSPDKNSVSHMTVGIKANSDSAFDLINTFAFRYVP